MTMTPMWLGRGRQVSRRIESEGRMGCGLGSPYIILRLMRERSASNGYAPVRAVELGAGADARFARAAQRQVRLRRMP
jgi:hypothetical protein